MHHHISRVSAALVLRAWRRRQVGWGAAWRGYYAKANAFKWKIVKWQGSDKFRMDLQVNITHMFHWALLERILSLINMVCVDKKLWEDLNFPFLNKVFKFFNRNFIICRKISKYINIEIFVDVSVLFGGT